MATGAGRVEHGMTSHVAAVSSPFKQLLVPLMMKPAVVQVGRQVEPDTREAVQSPMEPSVGALDASQSSGSQVAAVSAPFKQLLVPLTVKPVVLQIGRQVVPDTREAVQSPTEPPPVEGKVDASQGSPTAI